MTAILIAQKLTWSRIGQWFMVIRTTKNLGYTGGAYFSLKYAFVQKDADFELFTNNDVLAGRNII